MVREAFEESPFEWGDVSEVVSGGADGVDGFGEELAGKFGVDVSVFSVEYVDEAPNRKVAPLVRNTAMAEYADGLVAVQEGNQVGRVI